MSILSCIEKDAAERWMQRFNVLCAVLLLGACSGVNLPEETGAPPRSLPADQKVEVRIVPDAELQKQPDAVWAKELWGKSVLGLTVVSYARSVPCVIEITDRPMTAEQRARIIAHERRHCAGQRHIQKGNTLVWLP